MNRSSSRVSLVRRCVGLVALIGVAASAWFLFPDARTGLVDALALREVQDLFHEDVAWPPQVGEPYPSLVLEDRHGQLVPLQKYRGKVLLIEPIGTACRACIAFAGGHERGAFDGAKAQKDLPSLEKLLARFAPGASLMNDDIVLVQILLYDKSSGVPDAEDARRWEEHFAMPNVKNRVVLTGTAALQGDAGYGMIPGFQLVDRNFVLRYDSTGHKPTHDLYKTLLPAVSDFVRVETPMTAEAAYETMPHRRTRFDVNGTQMNDREKVFFERLFTLVDRAMVARVETTHWLLSAGASGRDMPDYRIESDDVLEKLNDLHVPDSVEGAHARLVAAIGLQREYFEDWAKARLEGRHFKFAPGFRIKEHRAIRAASKMLIEAHAAIKKAFPDETPHNSNAFFDHLCALDFI
jgi:hypothetical protein